jgi:hypothetical protein
MRYRVYGVDGISREPRAPLSLEAASEEDARAQAKKLGMAVEEVEADQPKTPAPPVPAGVAPAVAPAVPPSDGERAGPDHLFAQVLVIGFRVLAGGVALLYLILFVLTWQAAREAEEVARGLGRTVGVPGGAALVRIIIEGVLATSLLLAVAEVLRLGMALERNTRGRAGHGEKRRPP